MKLFKRIYNNYSKAPDKSIKTIAFAGNPNVGKSTIFNELTGLNQHTGNWEGKTVGCAEAFCRSFENKYILTDIPGTNSLNGGSAEEEIAADFIRSNKPDAVVVVCDAIQLEKNLKLVLEIMKLHNDVIVCVNMMDEAERRKIKIDLKKLSQKLGVPVLGTAAVRKKGLKELLKTADDVISGKIICKPSIHSDVHEIFKSCVLYENPEYNKREIAADKILTGKKTAYPIMIAMLVVILWFTVVGANYLSGFLSTFLFATEEALYKLCVDLNITEWIREPLIRGMYHVLVWVISVMLPPMSVFFPLFSVLEEIGYLPRIAYNLDKPLKKCSSCGKQALTMCMGLGCNAVGVTGCRIIESQRERMLAVLTNSLIPCNGRFPAILAIISMFFISSSSGMLSSVFSAIALTVVIIFSAASTFLITKLLSKTLLKGEASDVEFELPSYRKPQILKVITNSFKEKTLRVLGRAVMVAAPAGLIIWLLSNLTTGGNSLLQTIANFLNPFAEIMGLDGVILLAFILGFPANEIVIPIILMVYTSSGVMCDVSSMTAMKELMLSNGWTWVTGICFIIFSIMHWPCSTTMLTIKNETKSLKWTLLAAVIPTAFGIILCILFSNFIKLIQILI